MPSDTVQSFAQQFNVPVESVEKYWEVGKEEAKKKGYSETDEDFYPYVVGVVRKMMGTDPNNPQQPQSPSVGAQQQVQQASRKRPKNILKDSYDKAYRYLKDDTSPAFYEFLIKEMREAQKEEEDEDTSKVSGSFLSVEPADPFAVDFPFEDLGKTDDAKEELKELYLRDPSETDRLDWNFVWKTNSDQRRAVAWAVIRDKVFEFTFTLYQSGQATWPLEWRVLSPNKAGTILGVVIDQLNADTSGLRVSMGQNVIPSEIQNPLREGTVKILKDYFKQFGKSLYSSIIFYALNKRNPTMVSFYDSLYTKLKSAFSNLKDGKELADQINSQKTPLSSAITERKYYVLKNSSGPKTESTKVKEDDSVGTTSDSFGDAIPADASMDRDRWKKNFKKNMNPKAAGTLTV